MIAVKHGKHNQISHGNRYGKAPSIERARRLRKAGEFQSFMKRARDRSGTKPRRERGSSKPKIVAKKPQRKRRDPKPKKQKSFSSRFYKRIHKMESRMTTGGRTLFNKMIERAERNPEYDKVLTAWMKKGGGSTLATRRVTKPFGDIWQNNAFYNAVASVDNAHGNRFSRTKTKSLSDIPNYTKATTAEACANCRWLRRSWCIKFKAKVGKAYTCDDWQETVKKEVSSTPTAVYAHGASGLFSMPGLGKREKQTPLQRAIAIKEKYSHASTQVDLPEVKPQINKIGAMIDPDDLGEYGVEKEPHITVKYGIMPDHLPSLQAIIEKHEPQIIRLGKLSLFKNPKFDVLKIEVTSNGLTALNKEICANIPHIATHDGYNPHLTVAYLKPGTGKKYLKLPNELEGMFFIVDELQVSDKDGKHKPIPFVKKTTKSRLDYALSLKHLAGQHDQSRHAYRYGKNLNLARARAIRKGGNWSDYKKRARGETASPKKQPKQPNKKKMAETKAFGQDPNTMYTFRNRVVDLDDLITSNTSTGAINPNYDKALQPRDRTRQGSQQQVDNVAKNLVPESMLFDFHQIDRGTPIIGSDMMVESGNGRSMALRRAKEQYPEQWASYQSKLRENLAQNGLDESELRGIKNPVIVRERLSKVNRTEFAKEANQANVLQMSPLERAKNDARTMRDSSLFNMTMGDDQSIDQALRSPKNSRFVQEFLGDLPDTERASLMRANGTLNQMGLWRMKAAIFSKTFPGEAGERLADTFLEGLDSTTKNFEKSIVRTLPKLAKAESLINSGQRPKVSIMTDASKALDMLARLRENKTKVDDYLRQGSLFSRELTPKQERLLAHFNQIGNSTVAIRNFFNTYADAVINLQNPQQMGLFGQALPSKDDIFAILQAQGVL